MTHKNIRRILKYSLIGVSAIILSGVIYTILLVRSLFAEFDPVNLPSYHPFKSAKAKKMYLTYYNERSQEWPVSYEDKLITTSQGETFVRISGPVDAEPLVILPSTSATSLFWIPNIEMLSQNFRTYNVDNIYDFGLSRNTQNIESSKDLTKWLDELFSALGFKNSINLMGLSFGGWLTSQYTLQYPDRLAKVIIIAPVATLYDIPGEWAWRGIIAAIPNKFFMKKAMVDWLFEDLSKKGDEVSQDIINDYMNDAIMALKCFNFRMPVYPTVLSDADLQSINVPALFLIGENEKLYSAQEAINRLNKTAPQIHTEIISDAGHDLTVLQADLVNQKVINFIKENE